MRAVSHGDQLTSLCPFSLFEMGFKWQSSFPECGVICTGGINCSVHVHSRPVCSCWVLLEAFNLLQLWRCSLKIDCGNEFYVYSLSEKPGAGVAISFSLRSSSSDSVLLSLFPKNPSISAPCLNWESVSDTCFLLVCLEAVVSGFLVICVCSMVVLLTIVVSNATNPYVLWWEFKVFPTWVIEYTNRLVFREREVNGRALKVCIFLLFSCKRWDKRGKRNQINFPLKEKHTFPLYCTPKYPIIRSTSDNLVYAVCSFSP